MPKSKNQETPNISAIISTLFLMVPYQCRDDVGIEKAIFLHPPGIQDIVDEVTEFTAEPDWDRNVKSSFSPL